jgi:protein phosphatase
MTLNVLVMQAGQAIMPEYVVTSALQSHRGLARKANEDYATCYEPTDPQVLSDSGRLYVVADGVGGMQDGALASAFAAQSVLHGYYAESGDPGRRLRTAIRQAGRAIHQSNPQMATTMVAALIVGNRLIVANIGDSRAYLIRDRHVTQLSIDHTVSAEFARLGAGDGIPRRRHRDPLTRSLGGDRDPDVDLYDPVELLPGDRILLCSDGLVRYIRPNDLFHLAGSDPPHQAVDNCINFALNRGGEDNVSALVVAVGEPAKTAGEAAARHSGAPLPPLAPLSGPARSGLLDAASPFRIIILATGALLALAGVAVLIAALLSALLD